jgi:RNA polymerase sigma factor (sigma-70 family)
MGPLDRAEDERLVLALRAGDDAAFGQLFDRWYDRVHELARRITRDDGLAGDVAQDAFLAAWQRLDGLEDPAAFGGWLLRIARNRALDVVRSPVHTRTHADEDVSTIVDEQATADRVGVLDDPVEVVGDREVQELIWSAAATLGERDLTALDLSLRHGLDPAEIGEVLGINRNAANQLVHRMRGRLGTAIRSRVLWRGGRPACSALEAALAADGLDAFDARAVRVADRHAGTCDECSRRRDTRLDPAQLFAAVPVVAAPILLKAKAAAALEAAGVPMTGASGATGATGATGSGRATGGSPSGRGRVSRRSVALGAVAIVVMITVVAVVFVESLDHDGPIVSVEGGPVAVTPTTDDPAVTTTTRPGRITVQVIPDPAPSDTTVDDAPDPGEVPVAEPNPGGGTPPPPPPPPAAPTGAVSVSPSTRPPTVPTAAEAVVSWTSSNGTSVSISGPGLSSGAASGSQRVCPGTVVTDAAGNTYCVAPVGTYTYTLTVTGPGGSVQRSATLTVS